MILNIAIQLMTDFFVINFQFFLPRIVIPTYYPFIQRYTFDFSKIHNITQTYRRPSTITINFYTFSFLKWVNLPQNCPCIFLWTYLYPWMTDIFFRYISIYTVVSSQATVIGH